MELKDVVSVAGMPGLHKVVAERKNGLIIESLDGSGKKTATGPTHKVSVLGDIAMFTKDGEEKLGQVLFNLHAQGDKLTIPEKNADNQAFEKFLNSALPDYDRERVYVSDIKKLATWFGLLKDQLDFDALKKGLDEANEEDNSSAESKSAADAKVKTKEKTAKVHVKTESKSKGKSVNTIRKMA
jgi:hypothetical protein